MRKISDLIAALQAVQEEHGDLEVSSLGEGPRSGFPTLVVTPAVRSRYLYWLPQQIYGTHGARGPEDLQDKRLFLTEASRASLIEANYARIGLPKGARALD